MWTFIIDVHFLMIAYIEAGLWSVFLECICRDLDFFCVRFPFLYVRCAEECGMPLKV